MKKIILFKFIISLLITFSSCGKSESNQGTGQVTQNQFETRSLTTSQLLSKLNSYTPSLNDVREGDVHSLEEKTVVTITTLDNEQISCSGIRVKGYEVTDVRIWKYSYERFEFDIVIYDPEKDPAVCLSYSGEVSNEFRIEGKDSIDYKYSSALRDFISSIHFYAITELSQSIVELKYTIDGVLYTERYDLTRPFKFSLSQKLETDSVSNEELLNHTFIFERRY
ncbi:MAG: hypothetical protein CME70_03190 [Halobacteriovorax sp.]|nr:hypothetical protein [Halobacteriovorax sp.]MBK22988.1 hypothetical protein [Halobacteriovorax sp.]